MKSFKNIAVLSLILFVVCPLRLQAQNVSELEPNDSFPGQQVPVPFTTNNTGVIVSAGILDADGNADDYFCFENEFDFQMMRVTIRRVTIDGADTLNWEMLDENETQFPGASGTIQATQSRDLDSSGGEKVYVHISGNPNVNATYEIEVVGIDGINPATIAATAAALAAEKSKLKRQIKKLKKKIKSASSISKKSKLKAKLKKVKNQLKNL